MCAVPKHMHFWPDCYKHTLLAAKVGEMQSELCHEKRAFFDIHTNSRYLYTYKQQIPWSEVWSGNLLFPGQAHSIQHIYIYNTEYRKEPFHEENSLSGICQQWTPRSACEEYLHSLIRSWTVHCLQEHY